MRAKIRSSSIPNRRLFILKQYAYGENRYRTLKQSHPEEAAQPYGTCQKDVTDSFRLMEQLAALKPAAPSA